MPKKFKTNTPLDIPDLDADNCEICGVGIWRESNSTISRCKTHSLPEFCQRYSYSLIEILESYLLNMGWKAANIWDVAARCVSVEEQNIARAFICLGYRFNQEGVWSYKAKD